MNIWKNLDLPAYKAPDPNESDAPTFQDAKGNLGVALFG
jgi:hypothetical protein